MFIYVQFGNIVFLAGSEYSIACAWLRVGALRYYLLICCDDLDPAVKYSIRYSQLVEKIASLEVEIEVS